MSKTANETVSAIQEAVEEATAMACNAESVQEVNNQIARAMEQLIHLRAELIDQLTWNR